MLGLIITIGFGLILAYFATQNTAHISLNFLNYTVPGIPVYVAVIGALLIGLFLSWIISIENGIITGFRIRGKESKINDYRAEHAKLTKQIHQLEVENARLKGEKTSS